MVEGLFARAFKSEVQPVEVAAALQHEIDAEKKAADDMDISGTPAFVVVPGNGASGYFISGAQPYARFRKIIERALAEAK